MKERRPVRKPKSFAGQLLLAHPAMRDPNFRRAVILLSAHSAEGAMGVVLNRPLGKQLAELNTAFALGPLAVFLCGLDNIELAAMSLVASLVLVRHRKNIREEIARILGCRPVRTSTIQMHKGPNEEV